MDLRKRWSRAIEKNTSGDWEEQQRGERPSSHHQVSYEGEI